MRVYLSKNNCLPSLFSSFFYPNYYTKRQIRTSLTFTKKLSQIEKRSALQNTKKLTPSKYLFPKPKGNYGFTWTPTEGCHRKIPTKTNSRDLQSPQRHSNEERNRLKNNLLIPTFPHPTGGRKGKSAAPGVEGEINRWPFRSSSPVDAKLTRNEGSRLVLTGNYCIYRVTKFGKWFTRVSRFDCRS